MSHPPDYRLPGPCPVVCHEGELAAPADTGGLGPYPPLPTDPLPYRLYLPQPGTHQNLRALVLHSPGLGGNRDSGQAWLHHWASWGLPVLGLQHPGSDDRALGGTSTGPSPFALRRAWAQTRDQGVKWTRARQLAGFLAERNELPVARSRGPLLTWDRLALSGHSLGAACMQALAGETPPRHDDHPPLAPHSTPTRLAALVLLSPSARGDQPPLPQRFSSMGHPCLSITGTRDDGLGPGDIPATNRRLPHEHMGAREKYLLVLSGGNHGELAGQPWAGPAPDPLATHRRTAILGASAAFLLAQLGEGEVAHAARRWLHQVFPATLTREDEFVYPTA